MAATTNGNGNLVDEFEEAFQSCINILSKDEAVPTEKDEIKVDVDHTISRFIDVARQMEAFFLQKRFLLSALKPELVVKEDIAELRTELLRKEELIKHHQEKIAVWQNVLDLQGWTKSPAQASTPSGIPNGNPGGPQPPAPPTGTSSQGSTLPANMQQQMQQQQQQQLQQQLQRQQLQQMQQQKQQLQQKGPSGMPVASGSSGPGGLVLAQQVMFLQQQAAAGGPRGPPGFPGQGPLAYLEKTTSNIGLPERRR